MGECILGAVEVVPEVKVVKHHHKVEPEVVWLEHHTLVKVEEGHHGEARIKLKFYRVCVVHHV